MSDDSGWPPARNCSTRRKPLTRARRAERQAAQAPDGRDRQGLRLRRAERQGRLLDLFDGRRQLIVQHFMFDPSWDDGCPSCTAGSDEISPGLLRHLHARDTNLVVVSARPSSAGVQGTPRMDLPVVLVVRERLQPATTSRSTRRSTPIHVELPQSEEHEQPGRAVTSRDRRSSRAESMFLRDGDTIFHTCSMFARGAEATLGGSYYFLDLTPLGRQEEWEEPKGRADAARSSSRPRPEPTGSVAIVTAGERERAASPAPPRSRPVPLCHA